MHRLGINVSNLLLLSVIIRLKTSVTCYIRIFMIFMIFMFFKRIYGKTENRVTFTVVNRLDKNWKSPKPIWVHTYTRVK